MSKEYYYSSGWSGGVPNLRDKSITFFKTVNHIQYNQVFIAVPRESITEEFKYRHKTDKNFISDVEYETFYRDLYGKIHKLSKQINPRKCSYLEDMLNIGKIPCTDEYSLVTVINFNGNMKYTPKLLSSVKGIKFEYGDYYIEFNDYSRWKILKGRDIVKVFNPPDMADYKMLEDYIDSNFTEFLYYLVVGTVHTLEYLNRIPSLLEGMGEDYDNIRLIGGGSEIYSTGRVKLEADREQPYVHLYIVGARHHLIIDWDKHGIAVVDDNDTVVFSKERLTSGLNLNNYQRYRYGREYKILQGIIDLIDGQFELLNDILVVDSKGRINSDANVVKKDIKACRNFCKNVLCDLRYDVNISLIPDILESEFFLQTCYQQENLVYTFYPTSKEDVATRNSHILEYVEKEKAKETSVKPKSENAYLESVMQAFKFSHNTFQYKGSDATMLSILGDRVLPLDTVILSEDKNSFFYLRSKRAYLKFGTICEIVNQLNKYKGYCIKQGSYSSYKDASSYRNMYYCLADSSEELVSKLELIDGFNLANKDENVIGKLFRDSKYYRYCDLYSIKDNKFGVTLKFSNCKIWVSRYSLRYMLYNDMKATKLIIENLNKALRLPIVKNLRVPVEFVFNVYNATGGYTSSARQFIKTYKTIDEVLEISANNPSVLFEVRVFNRRDKNFYEEAKVEKGRIVAYDGISVEEDDKID